MMPGARESETVPPPSGTKMARVASPGAVAKTQAPCSASMVPNPDGREPQQDVNNMNRGSEDFA